MVDIRIVARWVRSAVLVVGCLSCVDGTVTGATANAIAYLSVGLKASSLRIGEKTTSTVTFYNKTGVALTARAVTWASSIPSVATVSASGEVTALGPGTTTIVATADGKSGAANVTVDALSPSEVPVASVVIAFNLPGLRAGQSMQAAAVARDVDGNVLTGRSVVWETSDPSLVTVSADGVVTAVGAGPVTITATTEGASSSVTFLILPAQPAVVASIVASVDVSILQPGQTTPVTAVVLDAAGNELTGRVVTWASSNTAVATVSSAGVVAIAPGTTNIVASSEGQSDNVAITVQTNAPTPPPPTPGPVPVATVTTSLTSPTIQIGQVTQGKALLRDATGNQLNGRAVAWTSSNSAVASVSSNGIVTGLTAGSTTITATSETKTGSAPLAVEAPPPVAVATVAVTLAAPQRTPGQTTQATAVTRDANGNTLTGRTVTWATSNASVATVSASGVVTSVAPGSANIVATSEGKTGSAAITVTAPPPAPVATVIVNIAISALQPGQTTQATAVTLDASGFVLTGRTVTWSSSNPAVATVSSSGVVTAVSAGSAAITATSETKTGSATVTIPPPGPAPVATVAVTLANGTLGAGQTTQASAVTRDANANVLTGRVITWASSNTAVATVSSSGLVTAVSAGSASITATSETKSGNATVTVTSAAPAPVATVTTTLGNGTIVVGSTTQATAVTRDANSNVLTGRVITWASSNTAIATVSNSGLVSAVAVGSASITATSEGKSGSATLTVQAAPQQPPIDPTSHEPAGMTKVTERAFNAVNEDGWVANYNETNNCTIVQDATAPKSASNVGQFKYPQGFQSGGAPCDMDRGFGGNYRTMYWSWYFKYANNYYGDASGVGKHGFLWSGGRPTFVPSCSGAGSSALIPEFRLQDNASGNYGPNVVPSTRCTRGVWHRWEVLVSLDGNMDSWFDGVLVGHYTGIGFSGDSWGTIQFAPNFGGAGGPPMPAETYLWIDHLYLSGK